MAKHSTPKSARSKSKGKKPTESVRALPVRKIVSGGQTGVDRAALEAAIVLGIPHGGWCPRGRLAEDGAIPVHYKLQETESRRYHIRTELNVRDSQGTLILYRQQLTGGTSLTRTFAQRLKKPLLCIDVAKKATAETIAIIRQWLLDQQIETLNIAGPRESSAPGIATEARNLLLKVLGRQSSPTAAEN